MVPVLKKVAIITIIPMATRACISPFSIIIWLNRITSYNVCYTKLLRNQNLRDLEIIVPNRRTGLFLKKALTESAEKTSWMPVITTRNNFV